MPSNAAAELLAADPVETAGRLRLVVARMSRLLRRQDEGDLSPTLNSALATIAREGPLTLGELAAHEHVAPPSITRVADKLERRGFVVRRPDERDRRICRVAITSIGRQQIEANRHRRTAWLTSCLQDLPGEDLAAVEAAVTVLERVTAGVVRP